MYMSEKEQFKVLFGHDQPKKKVVSSFDESQSKTIVRTCTYVSAGSNTYFSLTYFEFRTVSYGPSFFSSDLDLSWKKRGSITYGTNRGNEISKIFMISLSSNRWEDFDSNHTLTKNAMKQHVQTLVSRFWRDGFDSSPWKKQQKTVHILISFVLNYHHL